MVVVALFVGSVVGFEPSSQTRKSSKITIATGCRAVVDNRKMNSTC